MSNVRIASIVLSLVLAGGLIALAWYQAHGGHLILPISDLIFIVVMLFALVRFATAVIRCMRNKVR
ncbi:hypothetical protein [Dyella mobilis]|uniref:Uncharacterized protein n=1 Tax=Dyella mobilis TaxID=1849582 RepID=A0ABS2KLQ5_9GAMM|nr:hypothetical protein [Dyella mobilis]MBM7131869.1 hypothetical protein [Dyella mobilis]